MLRAILLAALVGTSPVLRVQALSPAVPGRVQGDEASTKVNLELKIANPREGESARVRDERVSIQQALLPTNARPVERSSESSTDWWLIVPTWFLAFFTLGLFLYTAKLWAATSNLVKDAAENAQRQLRAYVFEELVVLPGEVPAGHTPSFELTVRNFGNTPAENVVICVARTLAASNNPTLPPLQRTDRGSVFSLAQSATRPLTIRSEVLPEGGAEAIGSGKDLYIYGDILYTDVFGKRCVIELRYRWRFGTGVLELCGAGNKATYGMDPDSKE